MNDKQPLGLRGVDAGAAYLERIGMRVIDRTWRVARGVIDIVGWDGDTLIVVDVTTRQAGRQGEEWTATPAKVRRVRGLAKAYIDQAALGESTQWRYDRVDLLLLGDDRALLRHHRGVLSSNS